MEPRNSFRIGKLFGIAGRVGGYLQNKGYYGNFDYWVDVRERDNSGGFGSFLFQQCGTIAAVHFLVFRKSGKPVVAGRFDSDDLFFGWFGAEFFQQ